MYLQKQHADPQEDYSSGRYACSATKPWHLHKLRELRNVATQIHLYQLPGPLPEIPTSILHYFNCKASVHSEVRILLSVPCFWMSLWPSTIMSVLLSVQMKWSIINFTNNRLAWEAAGTVESMCCWKKCTDEFTGHLKYQYQLTRISAYWSSPYLLSPHADGSIFFLTRTLSNK